ncbi:MAG: signal peptidase I [SAR202 cluster bacterium]|nr:signal peptidase I [Chloroflexota bacterium]MQG22891.1 signal peptidase I [SAR202 cluster bacterium]|tara:strand:+ start:6633 stop:7049 length:417 start_codon:yes stop_codon:yes gene_type:complete
MFQIIKIKNRSMEPNFHNNDIILAKNWDTSKSLKRKQVVIAKLSDEYIIKRIIGLPKDKIRISEGSIFINRTPLDEPYLDGLPKTYGTEEIEYTIPDDHVFLIGDYRNYFHAVDSRKLGPVHISKIIAISILKLWSNK